ncbi:DnaJ-domain-containing protein [Wallemia mellicola]|uniref:DnaJ-domain-containing protein n=1 Tax=Wallemia mellicola TaxID=1708541 RepID=A0A4T0LYV2_9BASI|nr:hypothetical protein E3Q24_04135 [Wallemia mellicola]TIB70408.1 hypothetical protein E3Q23_04176 [Wallemia mellicola]TIB75450.1 DnaJ-domain-containing protein [Wallemia mellicola]TIB79333.1 DnaJ-domain-containing protein [Wallemia mellicola]TIB83472.1 DnaJ-domain-containing protein [Wallemia mellicola]
MKQNHYDTLNISKDASQKDIKLSYRKLALQNHPDRTGKATDEQFREIQEAYSVLSDPMRKREYDLTNGSASIQLILIVTILAMIYLVYKISTFLPILLLCLLTINASKLGRSRALPLTLIILSFTSGWLFSLLWVISIGSNLDDVEWLFWGSLSPGQSNRRGWDRD